MTNATDMQAFAQILAVGLVVGLILTVVIYLLWTIPFFKLFKKAGYEHPWLAFIPLGNLWPFFWVIGKSRLNILWFLLPLLGEIFMLAMHNAVGIGLYFITVLVIAILSIIWYVQLFKAYGMSGLWLLLFIGFIIPFIDVLAIIGFIVILWIMAFGQNYTYRGPRSGGLDPSAPSA